MSKKRKARRAALAAALTLAALVLPGFDQRLRVQSYTVETGCLGEPIRIALITDLHSCAYGEGARVLTDAIDNQAPDLVMLAGDIFDEKLPSENTTKALLQNLQGRYPCFYVTGNHEYWSDGLPQNLQFLAECGVTVLSGAMETVTVRGQTINICGVDDPEAQWYASVHRLPEGHSSLDFSEQLAQVKELSRNGNYTVLLSHRPESFNLYAWHGFDLVLCGHAHGGQWRIPGLLNGLYAPHQGFFPDYAGGLYASGETTMIVSRGLARESTRLPRFYNRPELVIVELQ